MSNYPEGTKYHPDAPWNQTESAFYYLKAVLVATKDLLNTLEDLRYHMGNSSFYRIIRLPHRHDSPLSFLDELQYLLECEIHSIEDEESDL